MPSDSLASAIIGHGETVYVAGYRVTSVDPSDNRTVWEYFSHGPSGTTLASQDGFWGFLHVPPASRATVRLDSASGARTHSIQNLGNRAGVVQISSSEILAIRRHRSQSVPNDLVAVDAESGEELWTASLGVGHWVDIDFDPFRIGEIPGMPGWLYLQNRDTLLTLEAGTRRARGLRYVPGVAPIVSVGKLLYVLEHGEVQAVDHLGKHVWATTLPNTTRGWPSVNFTALVVTDTAVIVRGVGRLWALDRLSGKVIWNIALRGKEQFGIFPRIAPVAAGDVVYVVVRQTPGKPFNVLEARSLRTGQMLRAREFKGSVGPMMVHRGALYLVETPVDD